MPRRRYYPAVVHKNVHVPLPVHICRTTPYRWKPVTNRRPRCTPQPRNPETSENLRYRARSDASRKGKTFARAAQIAMIRMLINEESVSLNLFYTEYSDGRHDFFFLFENSLRLRCRGLSKISKSPDGTDGPVRKAQLCLNTDVGSLINHLITRHCTN